MKLEKNVIDIIEGRKKAPLAKNLLRAMSQGYRAASAVRNLAYDYVLPQAKLRVPVVSIGNIVAGGSGKTPFVEYLAKALSPKKIAILSRGYKRHTKKTVLVKPTTPTEFCGDEPALLARKLPEARILVGKSRAFTGQLAQMLDSEVILLDDGMQHRALARDVEICVMHSDDLFGKDHFLPRGFLRDSPKRLKKADLIILNGVEDEAHFEKLKAILRPYTKAPIASMKLQVENSAELTSKKVAAFSAIAQPRRFEKTLKTLGCDIVASHEKPDHDSFSIEEVQMLANSGAQCLVCTEKDAVKLPEKLHLQIPLIPVKISHVPQFGEEHIQEMIEKRII